MNKPTEIDTHTLIKEYQEAGFNEKQAEAQVYILKKLLTNSETATKKDIELLEGSLKKDIELLEGSLRKEIEGVKTELKGEIKSEASGILKWVFGFIFANTGILLAVLKFFH